MARGVAIWPLLLPVHIRVKFASLSPSATTHRFSHNIRKTLQVMNSEDI
jgi:hypothetical protein